MKVLSPAANPMRSPGRLERFESEWKIDDVGEVLAGVFEHAGRRVLPVDFRVALVGEDQEAIAARKRDQALEVGRVGDRALRVRRRGEIERNRAREQLGRQRVEIGQEAVLGGGVEIDRLAVGRDRTGRVDRIERIGDQHRGATGARGRPSVSPPAPRGTGLRGCRPAPESRSTDRSGGEAA